jgi:GTP-binding protein Era
VQVDGNGETKGAAAPGTPGGFVSGFAALVGRPNVGKSTLCNRLVGEKVAIASPVPQTTRHRIAGVQHLPGAQIVWLDTPGLHRPRDLLGQSMVRAARDALAGADVACLVVDAAAAPPRGGDRRAAWTVFQARCPRLLVVNKVDLLPAGAWSDCLAAYRELAPAGAGFDEVLPVSAVTGQGCAELVEAVRRRLPPGPAYFPPDAVTDRPEQFLCAELVREQALQRLRDELPHAVAVTVDEWREQPGRPLYIAMTLFVERESQKGIVIGRGATMLRSIGQGARAEVERRLGTPVYLDLRVKVREGWRNRPGSLETMGLGSSGLR